ncbi:MAG: TatD family deoxyribonuclease [Acholeplasmatales bacterium]|nr:MAG: TatD family deoxyribonuclease [Acholeplasmatales bacterium]
MLIDTHVHLNNPALLETLPAVLEKAERAGVKTMVVVGYDPASNLKALELAKTHTPLYAAVGFHPTEATKVKEADYATLAAWLECEKVVALGEIGLDFYWDKTHHDTQVAVFKRQIEMAQARRLPIAVHMRDATEKTYETLKPYAPLVGVMHCYSGSAEMAEKFVGLGMHISLGGPVTFKNARVPKAVARIVPLERLLIETDAPYLAPHPYRGKQNHPGYLPLIAQAIADERGITYEAVAEATTRNARKLFLFKEAT